MRVDLDHLMLQPQVGIGTILAGSGVLAASWFSAPHVLSESSAVSFALLALSLIGAVVLSYQFPIHTRHNTKIHMTSVPLFLMIALLPPPLAASTVGAGMLVGELSVKKQRGGHLSDIASQVGRWIVIAAVGSVIAHAESPSATLRDVPLIAAALFALAGDIVTSPLLLSPIGKERPGRVIAAVAREAALPEGTQYLIGLIGAYLVAGKVWLLALLVLPVALVYLAFKSAKEMRESTREIVENMADAVDLRDPYTGGHSRRVTEYTAGILREMGRNCSGAEYEVIVSAARVHDIGKIGIPDDVLKKEGTLTPGERKIMEAHAEEGAKLLQRYPDFALGVDLVRHHHEAWDGTGYPDRLKGTDIPFGSRVIAVADSFDAMTTDRPYRHALSPVQAAAILREGRGGQWDPTIVDAFLRSVAERLQEPEESHRTLVRRSAVSAPARVNTV